MNRCTSLLRSPSLLLAALGFIALVTLAPAPAQAQTSQNGVREFPKAAQRGKLVVTAPPEVTLNGKPDRLSPGARVRDTQSLLVMTGAIVGNEYTVNYLRDSAGLIHEVWILNAAEAKEKRPGMPPARNFVFDSDPPKIDPNTPFDKLPKYDPNKPVTAN
jgi:hypothetical protein